ncbi:sulfatase-like hydrolase/transferase [Methanosarcina vacuolata]|uniref:sulfatase-like hydrolase/transferase n=1 Tax=Methanosarcina vacuolata TaxID=2215 RepID=UPI001E65B9F3|nr:sulfatase-like hydrolase/transferase [Methanosarcina vacuolata]
MLDNTGFGQFGCYGNPIQTPNLDSLAAGGLIYKSAEITIQTTWPVQRRIKKQIPKQSTTQHNGIT